MGTMSELGAAQQLTDRPFTDLARNQHDLALMQRILVSLINLIATAREWPEPPLPLVVRGNDEERVTREVVCNRAALLAGNPLRVVGFFGHRRPDLDTTILNAVDDDLIHEFALHPGVLSYSSFELDDGNYVNLVLLEGPAAQEHWRTSSRHTYAARELAPEFYAFIRLQNALLPHGLAAPTALQLVATKYYDYQQDPPWLALRALT